MALTRKIALLFFFTLSIGTVKAADLSLDNIRLSDLAKLTYTEISKTDFIADSHFNNDQTTVTVSYRSKEPEQIKQMLNELLQHHGYSVQHFNDSIFISRIPNESTQQKIPFYYKPKHRPSAYLTQILRPMFDEKDFHPKQDGMDRPGTESSPEFVPPGSALAQYNQDYDAFVFYGTPAKIELMQTLLHDLDTPQQELLVKAYIYEVSNIEGASSSFSAALSLLNGKLALGLAANTLANQLSFKATNVQAVFSAIASDSRFKTVSAPTLRVKDRNKAVFTVGQEVPVLSGITTTGNGTTSQSIQYVNSGVILELQPTIRADDIQLTINHQLSNFIQTTTGVNTSPTLLKREIKTTIDTRHDEIIILGGLEQQSDTDSVSGFPLLPKFLRTRSTDSTKSDILLILHVQKI